MHFSASHSKTMSLSNLPVEASLKHKLKCMHCRQPVNLNKDINVFGCQYCTNVICSNHAEISSSDNIWICPHCTPTREVTWNYFNMCIVCGLTIDDEDETDVVVGSSSEAISLNLPSDVKVDKNTNETVILTANGINEESSVSTSKSDVESINLNPVSKDITNKSNTPVEPTIKSSIIHCSSCRGLFHRACVTTPGIDIDFSEQWKCFQCSVFKRPRGMLSTTLNHDSTFREIQVLGKLTVSASSS